MRMVLPPQRQMNVGTGARVESSPIGSGGSTSSKARALVRLARRSAWDSTAANFPARLSLIQLLPPIDSARRIASGLTLNAKQTAERSTGKPLAKLTWQRLEKRQWRLDYGPVRKA